MIRLATVAALLLVARGAGAAQGPLPLAWAAAGLDKNSIHRIRVDLPPASPNESGAITPERFGARGDGATDDAPAFRAAVAAAKANGDRVTIGQGPYLIDSGDLTIPANVELRGRNCTPGGERPGNDYSGLPSTIIVNPAHTIAMGPSSKLACAVVKSKTLVTPTTTQQALAMVAGFSGNGITVAGDDATMQDLLVLGFDTGILSSGFQRPRIVDVLGDDTNGIVIDKAHDIAVIRHAEFAAFLTSNSSYNAPVYTIGAAADNGAGSWRLTVPANGVRSGDAVCVSGATTARGIDGCWTASVVDPTHIDLRGSATRPALTGTLTAGSQIVEETVPALVRIGMGVAGSGVALGTTVANVWNGRLYLSAAATQTGKVRLSFSDTPYRSNDGSLYLDVDRRKGAAFTVTHSETAQLSDIFEYGFDIGIHIGDGTSWTTLVNASVDNYIAVGDPSTVGVLVDGATAGVSWIGGATSSYGTALKVDTSVRNGNANAVMVSGVALNPGSGQQFARLMPSVDVERGRVVLSGVTSNTGAFATIMAGPGATSLVIAGSDLAHQQIWSWDGRANGAITVDTSSALDRNGVPFFVGPRLPMMTPPIAGAPGCAPGQVTMDQNFLFGCTAANQWKRVPWSTF